MREEYLSISWGQFTPSQNKYYGKCRSAKNTGNRVISGGVNDLLCWTAVTIDVFVRTVYVNQTGLPDL